MVKKASSIFNNASTPFCKMFLQLKQLMQKYQLTDSHLSVFQKLWQSKPCNLAWSCSKHGISKESYEKMLVPLRMVPPSKFWSFCETSFCPNLKTNKVKYTKVYILERKFHKRSMKKSDFLLRTAFLQKHQKFDFFFLAPKFYNFCQKIFFYPWSKVFGAKK